MGRVHYRILRSFLYLGAREKSAQSENDRFMPESKLLKTSLTTSFDSETKTCCGSENFIVNFPGRKRHDIIIIDFKHRY